MRFAICVCLTLFAKYLAAQDLILSPIGESLCQPGVIGKSPGKGIMFDYTFLPSIKIYPYKNGINDSSPQRSSSNNLNFKMKIPIIHKPNFTLLLGYAHYREEYNVSTTDNGSFSVMNSVHDRTLKSSRYSINIVKPLNDKFYLAFKGDASFNGDYDGLFNFDSRYLKYNVGLMLGVKKRPNFEWGAGLLFRSSFIASSVPVLPFGLYNYTFNNKWGIEAIVPVSIKVRYNIDLKSHILFGPEYESRSYSLDTNNPGIAAISSSMVASPSEFFMRRSELKLAVAYQRQLTDWIWFNVQTGYSHNFNTRFTEIDYMGTTQPDIAVDFANGVYFKVGLFLSPPKNKCK